MPTTVRQYCELTSDIASDQLRQVQDFDPVLAAFRIFDRDHSGALSADELAFFVSQIPGIGKVRIY